MSVLPAASKREMQAFIEFTLALYQGDEHYVAPLSMERRAFFDPRKNPLFDFTDAAYFLARLNGKVVGRVSAQINRRHVEYWKEPAGFFGFFECIDDAAVAADLLKAAEEWLAGRGMSIIRGPFNFSTNDECGFLSEGFEKDPVLMMTYTKPYYLKFMRDLRYRRVKELLAYEFFPGERDPVFLEKLVARVKARTHVSIRPIHMHRFEEEVAAAFAIYNSAWEKNWGFVPMTEAEFRFIARSLKPIIDPDFALMAEENGRLVGFSIALPDFNQVLKKMRGRLFPTGFWHALFGRKHIHVLRVIALGVLKEFRTRGIDTLLYEQTWRLFREKKFRMCEMSWVLEDNDLMRKACERLGGVIGKRYEIFEKSLVPG